jgi:hypothetical protein
VPLRSFRRLGSPGPSTLSVETEAIVVGAAVVTLDGVATCYVVSPCNFVTVHTMNKGERLLRPPRPFDRRSDLTAGRRRRIAPSDGTVAACIPMQDMGN